ncbi:MAG TPA: hypothetical protein VHL31_02595 [Geminicoccus sp.]|uniref:hypothetical protein n=1 Tax=Geminicoccus sp. TaxID=2024832 RepID=UPI002E34BC49|nr:hypothetical protein [Geminicoccus sp.]HEX2525174.1 hypothetical protein [Geminicoccus sp.]
MLALAGSLAAASHLAVGGGWSAGVPVVLAIGMTVSAVLSMRFGIPCLFSLFDQVALAVTLLGLLAWVVFGAPLVTLLSLLMIDGSAMMLNIRKVWRFPDSEAPGPWTVTVTSDVVNLFAIGGSEHGWIYPMYLLVTNLTMLASIHGARYLTLRVAAGKVF